MADENTTLIHVYVSTRLLDAALTLRGAKALEQSITDALADHLAAVVAYRLTAEPWPLVPQSLVSELRCFKSPDACVWVPWIDICRMARIMNPSIEARRVNLTQANVLESRPGRKSLKLARLQDAIGMLTYRRASPNERDATLKALQLLKALEQP